MTNLPHIPILRHGQLYTSLETSVIKDSRTGEAVAEISMANPGMIRRDTRKADEAFAKMQAVPTSEMIARCEKAADFFMNGHLPLGTRGVNETVHGPDDYVEMLGATSGLPHVMIRRNMEKIAYVLSHMGNVLKGLSRGLDPDAIDAGFGDQSGVAVSYFPAGRQLGVVLPSNSPGVNSIWLPSVALRVPVVLKPGREEPWTPWRIIQAMLAAGVPKEGLSFYPTTHEGSAEVMASSDQKIIFGDEKTVSKYANDPTVEVHGPGWSKVLVGNDMMDHPDVVDDLIVASVLDNGGRSCINASTVLLPRDARATAARVAQRLAAVTPTTVRDEHAKLSCFANRAFAESINEVLDNLLKEPGAIDLTAEFRDGPRLVHFEDAVFLLPTLVYCEDRHHPLAKTEFMFPFASVVEMPQADMLGYIGATLVASGITEDPAWTRELLASPHIHRLNLGRMPTTRVEWEQPHEGNLFEFLYRRRAIQRAPASVG